MHVERRGSGVPRRREDGMIEREVGPKLAEIAKIAQCVVNPEVS